MGNLKFQKNWLKAQALNKEIYQYLKIDLLIKKRKKNQNNQIVKILLKFKLIL